MLTFAISVVLTISLGQAIIIPSCCPPITVATWRIVPVLVLKPIPQQPAQPAMFSVPPVRQWSA